MQSSYDSDNIGGNTARLINCYRQGTGARNVLKAAASMSSVQTLQKVPGRRLGCVNEKLFGVAGGTLYEISSSGSATGVATLVDDADTFIEGYAANVLIAAGGNYYVYASGALSAITGGAITTIGGLAFVGGYAVMTEKNGGRFEWATLQDPSTRNPLHVASSEAVDDNIVQPLELNGNLYLFGTQSIEIWQTTGDAGAAAFGRLSGSVLNRGLKAKGLVEKIGSGAFFVGDDNAAYVLAGSQMQKVSTPQVETAIAQGSPTDCFYFEDEGEKFAAIRFSDRPSWVWQIGGEWFERAQGTDLDHWNCISTAKCYGGTYGLTTTGDLFKFGRDNADLGGAMIRRAITGAIENNGEYFTLANVEARARVGFSDIGRDASISMRISRDRGATYTAPKTRSLGDLGDHGAAAKWNAQGVARQVSLMFDISDPAELPLYEDLIVKIA